MIELKCKKFSYRRERSAEEVREKIESLYTKIDAVQHAAWRNGERVDHKNPEIAKLIQEAKKLCHWNSHHVKVKDGKNIIVETDDICVCPGKNFVKCHSLLECIGHGLDEFEGEDEKSDETD